MTENSLVLLSADWNKTFERVRICFVPQASSKRQHHLNKHLYRPSTFLTSYEPPVFMDEDDERSAYYGGVQDPSADDSVSPLSHHRSTTPSGHSLFSVLFFYYWPEISLLPCVTSNIMTCPQEGCEGDYLVSYRLLASVLSLRTGTLRKM